MRACRYRGRDWEHPRIPAKGWPRSLQRRVDERRRPKILVAGLSARVEAFLDEEGLYLGAVSTFSIFDPEDSLPRLRALVDYLCSERVSERFRALLGANALGGGNITMKKSFLQLLPLPERFTSPEAPLSAAR